VIKVDNMYFTGRFDEIRKGLIIRDHKSGWYRPTELELNHDPQFTIYVLMLATLAHFHEGFAQLIGVPKRLANTWAGNPVYLPAEVAIEHYHMRSDKITPTHRLDVQLEDLMKTVIDLSGRIAKGDFPTNRRSCRKCLWSEACDRDTFGIYPKGYTPQVELFGKPDLPRKIEVEQTKLEFPRIKSR